MIMKKVLCLFLTSVSLVLAQQECYFGPGAENRGPSNLVPCLGSGQSACCLLGDTCLSGNTCYNYKTGDLYQYGCTDITYTDDVCPYKCGWNTTLSPWTALEYCTDIEGVNNTWTCHAPESCGCIWDPNDSLLVLSPRGCKEMGAEARVALYAPSVLAPYVSLPATVGGSTGYYSPTIISNTSSWISTAVSGYTPATIAPLTTYQNAPSKVIQIDPGATPSASTAPSAQTTTATGAQSSVSSSSTAASSTTSSSNSTTSGVTSSSSPASSSGLSTGAKAGIGAGVAIGGLLVIALGVIIYYLRKKRTSQAAEHPQQHPHDPQYPHSPPMQPAPYYTPFPAQNEKPPGWQGSYGQDGHMPSPYLHQTAPHYGSPALYGSPESQREWSPPPMELATEHRVHELGSPTATS